MAESGIGQIRIFDDFTGGEEILVAATVAPPMTVGAGAFSLVGQGLARVDGFRVVAGVFPCTGNRCATLAATGLFCFWGCVNTLLRAKH